MLAQMADVGHFGSLDTVHILTAFKHANWSGFVFALIYHGHGMTFSHVDVLWNCLCSTRKYQGQIDSARPGPRCQRLHVSFSLPLLLYTYRYILSPDFIFLYIPIPCMLPSRTQASLRNAFSPFDSHAFMLRRHTVLTHLPSLFTFSLLGIFSFWN